MDTVNFRSAGDGASLAQMSALAENGNWRQQDYVWTHSAPVEGFFIVLTIAIVPVAFLRLLRRLRASPLGSNERPRRLRV